MFFIENVYNLRVFGWFQFIGSYDKDLSNNSGTVFSCGLVAGFLASGITHPADVIKTR
jgi:hypothetical protein